LRKIPWVVLLCAGLAISPARAVAGTILILGDSLGAAFGLEVKQGWVALLEKRLAGAGLSHEVVNASVSGDTSASARARLPGALTRHRPNVVVLEIGGNDGLRGLPLAQLRENLAAMIDAIRAADARVLLVGVQLPPNYGPRYTGAFDAVYRDLAAAKSIALVPSIVDGIGTDPGLMQADGIHPNAAAQSLMLDRVWPALQPLL